MLNRCNDTTGLELRICTTTYLKPYLLPLPHSKRRNWVQLMDNDNSNVVTSSARDTTRSVQKRIVKGNKPHLCPRCIYSYCDRYPLFASMATLRNYVLGIQGVLLLSNGAYMLLFPLKVAAPSSPMANTPISVVHAMRLAY